MLYHIAINTDVFDPATINDGRRESEIESLLDELCMFGTLANLHSEAWVIHIINQMGHCSYTFKRNIMDALKILDSRHRLIAHQRCAAGDPTDHLEWLQAALEIHRYVPESTIFDNIVLESALRQTCGINDTVLTEIHDIRNTQDWKLSSQPQPLLKKPVDYWKKLKPILRYAQTLAIVDPYLNPHKPICLATIRVIFAILAKYRPGMPLVDFSVHAGIKNPRGNESAQSRVSKWVQELCPLAQQYGQKISVSLWETHKAPDGTYCGELFHDRFILTNQCGILSTQSFECVTQSPSTALWSLLSEEERTNRIRSVNPGTALYNRLAQQTIC